MTSRSDCEPLPKPTLSPFALARPGTFLRVGFFTAAVWCVPALRVPLVHSLINHFRKKNEVMPTPLSATITRLRRRVLCESTRSRQHAVPPRPYLTTAHISPYLQLLW